MMLFARRSPSALAPGARDLKERVRERNGVDFGGQRGIDNEGYRHLARLAGGERLLAEPEAFQLAEVAAGERRAIAHHRLASHRRPAHVGHLILYVHQLARM